MLFDLPKEQSSIIKVIGIGGGGCNAVNHMFQQGIRDVNFVICNTDAQALEASPVPNRIQLGPELTKGRGAGSHPHMGQQATLESVMEIRDLMEKNTEMVFITAGMGGGTGTGGAPVVAQIAREMEILTVAIVTLPFSFEGRKRVEQARQGIAELKKHVDSIIVIVNDKIREVYGNQTFSEAFSRADDVLATAARGIAEIITIPGYVNVDFEDVKTVLRDSGVAIMGSGRAGGDNRAIDAVEAALSSPLLNDTNIQGARHVLLNITSGSHEVRMDEISEITEYVQQAAGNDSDIIWGNCFDEALGDELTVTVIATGFEVHDRMPGLFANPANVVEKVSLEESRPSTEPQSDARPAVAPSSQDPLPEDNLSPRLSSEGAQPGDQANATVRTIDLHVPVVSGSAPESEAVLLSGLLPFAQDPDSVLEEEPGIARLAPSAMSGETVGRAPLAPPPVAAAPQAEVPDPAQMSMPFTEEVPVAVQPVASASDRPLQPPVGDLMIDPLEDDEDERLDDDDWDDEEGDLDEDDDFLDDEDHDDLDFDDSAEGNSVIWEVSQPAPAAEKTSSPDAQPAPAQQPVYQVTSQPAQEPAAQNAQPVKPPIRLPSGIGKTVYPDGPLAVPPIGPQRTAAQGSQPDQPQQSARPEPPKAQPSQPDQPQQSARPEPPKAQPPKRPHSREEIEPYLSPATPEPGNKAHLGPDAEPAFPISAMSDAEREELIRREERRRRLRMLSMRTGGSLEEKEAVPAFVRAGVKLHDVPHSSDEPQSRYHLVEGKDGLVYKPNTYLHDKAD